MRKQENAGGRRRVAIFVRGDGSFGGNSQSTAWAVQGLVAVGVNPSNVSSGARNAFDYLAARQASDGM